MKIFFAIIISFSFTTSMSSQNYNLQEILIDFEHSELISEKGSAIILASKIFRDESKDFATQFLFELINVYTTEIVSEAYGMEISSIQVAGMGVNEQLKNKLQNDVGNSTLLTQKLIEHHIIPSSFEQQWESFDKKNGKGKIPMLGFYFEQLSNNKKLSAQSKKVEAAIPKLIKAGILDQDFYTQHSDYLEKTSELVKLMQFTKNGTVFYLTELSTDIHQGYQTIYEELNKLTEDVDFELTGLDFQHNKTEGNNTIVANIEITCNGKIYKDTFAHDYLGTRYTYAEKLRTNLVEYKVDAINEILHENNSLYKLYYLNFEEYKYQRKEAVFVYLTRNQYYALRETNKKHFITGPFPTSKVNAAIAEELIQETKKQGLIPADVFIDPSSITAFKDLIIQSPLLHQRIRTTKDEIYGNHIKRISNAIGDECAISNIEENWDHDNKKVDLTYQLNGKQMQYEDEIIVMKSRMKILSKIRSDLKNLSLKKNLVNLMPDGGGADLGMIYLDDTQIQFLKRNGLWAHNYLK